MTAVIAAAPPWLLRLVLATGIDPVPMSPDSEPTLGHGDGGEGPAETGRRRGLDAELLAALNVIPPTCCYEDWIGIGMALHEESGGSSAGFEVFHAWSATAGSRTTPSGNPAYRGPDECRAKWASFSTCHQSPVGRASLFKVAYRHGFIADGADRQDPTEQPPRPDHWPEDPEYVWSEQRPPEFPVESAFPPTLSWLAKYFKAIAWCYQVPVDLPVLLGMPIAMAALSGKANVKVPGERWVEPAVIWMLAAMRSGCLKSPVHRELVRPLRDWEMSLDMTQKRAEHKADLGVEDAKRKACERTLSGVRTQSDPEKRARAEDRLRQVVLRTEEILSAGVPSEELIASEATTERLVEIMERQKGRALVTDSEGDIFDVAMGRYSNQVPNLGPWLKGYDGDPIKQERVHRDRLVKRPLLNVGVATQPEALDFLTNKVAQGRGFVARLCAAIIPPTTGRLFMPGRDLTDDDVRPWGDVLKRLLDHPLPEAPQLITLSEEAAAAFKAWGQSKEQEADSVTIEEGEDPRDAWFRKFAGKVLRIALLLHCLHKDGFERTEIDLATMQAAIVWGNYLALHQRCVATATRSDPHLAIAERILGYLDRNSIQGQAFTRSSVHVALKGPNSTVQRVDDINTPLAALVERGWIKPLGDPLQRSVAHKKYEARPDLSAQLAKFRAQDAAAQAAGKSGSDGRPSRW